jgi:hypothetical protein
MGVSVGGGTAAQMGPTLRVGSMNPARQPSEEMTLRVFCKGWKQECLPHPHLTAPGVLHPASHRYDLLAPNPGHFSYASSPWNPHPPPSPSQTTDKS